MFSFLNLLGVEKWYAQLVFIVAIFCEVWNAGFTNPEPPCLRELEG